MKQTSVNNPKELPDLSDEIRFDQKIFVASGGFGMVYRCPSRTSVVAVKVVSPPKGIDGHKMEKFDKGLRRELGIWKRLEHSNIVPLLGKIPDNGFGFDRDHIVSMWMPRGSLYTRIENRGKWLATAHRVQLIKDVANGLEYLHSQNIVHGDLHPGNVLIGTEGKALLTDFGLSQLLLPAVDGLTYLRITSVHPGAIACAAPELVHPKLYPEWNEDGKPKATLKSDIYSFGNVVLFIFSGKLPWRDVDTALEQLRKRKIPQHREFFAVPDDIWKFVEKCWSPKKPGARPSANEALLFVSNSQRATKSLPRPKSFPPNMLKRTEPRPPSVVEPSTPAPRPIRILIIGNTGVGKPLFVSKVFGDEFPYASETINIHREFTSPKNDQFVVHYGPGFEVDGEGNMDVVQQFLAHRKKMPQLKDQVHMVWLYLEVPYFSRPLLETGVEMFLQRRGEILGGTPLVAVLTDVDLPSIQLEPEIPGNENLKHSWYPSERLVERLRSAARDDVTYAIVSTDGGYEGSISDLLKVTNSKVAEAFGTSSGQ